MKIVHLCRRYWPQQGGVETHVQKVSAQLIKEGHEVFVITSVVKNDGTDGAELVPKEKEIVDGVSVFRIIIPSNVSAWEHKLLIWKWMWTHRQILIAATVIQIHDIFWWIIPIHPLVYRKIFMTFHGYEPPGPPTKIQCLWHQLAHKSTVASLGIGSFHQKWYGVKPNLTSFGAVDKKVYAKKTSTKHGRQKPRSHLSIMYLGRLSDDVGIMAYLKSLSKLEDAFASGKVSLLGEASLSGKISSSKKISLSGRITLDVYGDGEKMSDAKAFVRSHKMPVRFLGSVSDAALFIPQYDYIFASRHLAILEVLSIGKPLIAHYNNQIKFDYLTLNTPFRKWISVFQDPQHLLEILTKPQQNFQPPKKAQQWAQQQTWKKMVENYRALWSM